MTAVPRSPRVTAGSPWPDGSRTTVCPSENAVVALLQGVGTAEERRAIEHHLDGCMDCHVLLAALARVAAGSSISTARFPAITIASAGATLAGGVSSGVVRAPPTPAVRGTRAGRYRLEEILGAGAMGVVYAAYDDELARRVAVKVVRPEWSGSEPHRARLLREACALARVVHPNVVTVYDVGTMDGNVFIAMEHVDGSSLQHWLRGRPRGWREILAVARGAARGLAAAHRAGLVHRDFKPQNVLVDGYGRAVVADFGLASPIGVDIGAGAAAPGDATAGSGGSALTATGAILGTPAYMAPEQRAGAPADTRSDQYSFCVVLHEALHGERPSGALGRSSVPPSTRRSAPRRRRAPAWLDRVVARGLDPDPARRHPSMDALLDALTPGRRTWPWLVPLFLLLAIGGVGANAWRHHVQREKREQQQHEACTVAARRADEIWNRITAARVKEAFLRTGLPYADGTWQGVDRHLGDYVASWSTMRLQVCTDALRTGPTELVAREAACLDDRLDELRAETELFSRADRRAVDAAPAAVSALVPATQCANVSALSPLLSDPAKAAKLRAFHADYARVHALILVGRWAEARAPAEENARAADLLAYGPAQAKAQLNLGVLHRYAGDGAAADAAFLRGLGLADAAGNDRLRVDAWIDLLGNLTTHPEAGFDRRPWYEAEARAALERLGGDERLEAKLRTQLALVSMLEGDLPRARSEADGALAATRRRLPADDIEIVRMLAVVGNVAFREGRYEDALAAFRESLDGAERGSGPDTPASTEALATMGTTLGRLGRSTEGLTYANRGVALAERDLPPDHPELAMQLDLRASLLETLGRHAEARRDAARALESVEKRFGRESPFLVGMLTTLGESSLALDDVKPAVASLERAVALCGVGCAQITRADVTFALAKALRRAGKQPKRAGALADEAIALYAAAHDETAETVQAWKRSR